MRLNVGTLAPVFKARTRNGGEFDLAAFRGRTVLVKFYRFATCPVCNLHLHRFLHDYPAVKALGVETVVLYHSPEARLERAQRDETPFPLVADPDKRVFRMFGVEKSWRGMFSLAVWRDYLLAMLKGYSPGMLSHDGGITGHPADFIVDPDGRIACAHYGRDYADSLTAADVVRAVSGIDASRPQNVATVAQFQTSAASR
jgi:peroxiredoxin